MNPRRLQARDYTIGWICALPIELAAAQEMLDEVDERLPRDSHDPNLYTLGRIGAHNVVLACLPAGHTGTQSAATVATRMMAKFVSIRFGLMVGIGGGVPSAELDIRLGDVVISQPYMQHGGVVQYDFGKTGVGGSKMRTGWLNAPPSVLLQAITEQHALHFRSQSKIFTYLSSFDRLESFSRDAAGPDVLFEATYDHAGGPTCAQCDKEREVARAARKGRGVEIHRGTIASGNQVMKDGATRDRISEELGGVMCFEMEAAGLMNDFPCLVIRGICDYADSHKNKKWQPYAAATAAACAKEILSIIPAAEVARTTAADETGQGRIEMKLDRLAREVRHGFKSPTLLALAHDLAALQRELVDDTITEVDVEVNKDFINEWLRKSRDSGGFDDPNAQEDENAAHEQYQQNTQGARKKAPKSKQAYFEDYDEDEGDVPDSDGSLSSAETAVPNAHHNAASPNACSKGPGTPTPAAYQREPIPTKNYSSLNNKPLGEAAGNVSLTENAEAAVNARLGRKSRRNRSRERTVFEEKTPYDNRLEDYEPVRTTARNYQNNTEKPVSERPKSNRFFVPPPSVDYPGLDSGNKPQQIPPTYTPANRAPLPGQVKFSPADWHQKFKETSWAFSPARDADSSYITTDDLLDRPSDPHVNTSNRHSDPFAPRHPPGHPSGPAAPAFSFTRPEDIWAEFRRERSIPEENFGSRPRSASPEVTVIERNLPISLEDLFTGTTKKMKITRKTYDAATSEYTTRDLVLEVQIKKGIRAGSKIKFKGVGDQTPEGTQDLHFIIQEKPHPLFNRDGNDLYRTVEITLVESLIGWSRVIDTIDGQLIKVSHGGPTPPTWQERFPSQGMPLFKNPSQRGDMLVGIIIKYPTSLTATQKAVLKSVLG